MDHRIFGKELTNLLAPTPQNRHNKSNSLIVNHKKEHSL